MQFRWPAVTRGTVLEYDEHHLDYTLLDLGTRVRRAYTMDRHIGPSHHLWLYAYMVVFLMTLMPVLSNQCKHYKFNKNMTFKYHSEGNSIFESLFALLCVIPVVGRD